VVPVVQAFYYSKYLGYFDLHFDANDDLKTPVDGKGVQKAVPIILNSSVKEDENVLVKHFFIWKCLNTP